MEDGNLYLRLRTMSHTIYAAKFEQTLIHQHVHLRRESQSRILLRRESQSHILLRRVSQSYTIDGASVTIILCLHVLIAHCILFILDMFIIFSEYRV